MHSLSLTLFLPAQNRWASATRKSDRRWVRKSKGWKRKCSAFEAWPEQEVLMILKSIQTKHLICFSVRHRLHSPRTVCMYVGDRCVQFNLCAFLHYRILFIFIVVDIIYFPRFFVHFRFLRSLGRRWARLFLSTVAFLLHCRKVHYLLHWS